MDPKIIGLLILFAAIGYAASMAVNLLRAKHRNPLADLERDGLRIEAEVIELEPDGDEPNIVVRYQVNAQSFRRSLPFPPDQPLPELGSKLSIRYLPSSPGLSRLD
jgi:hypothetical protein